MEGLGNNLINKLHLQRDVTSDNNNDDNSNYDTKANLRKIKPETMLGRLYNNLEIKRDEGVFRVRCTVRLVSTPRYQFPQNDTWVMHEQRNGMNGRMVIPNEYMSLFTENRSPI